MKQTIVVNLFGGPGTGKSTTATGVFSLLKMHNVDCEYIPEFAKDLVWENRNFAIQNQTYILGEQFNRLSRIKGKVDVAITDAPLINGLIYNKTDDKEFTAFCLKLFNSFHNISYFIKRKKIYNPNGRMQTENEAKALDDKILKMMNKFLFNINIVDGNFSGINTITTDILKTINIIPTIKLVDF